MVDVEVGYSGGSITRPSYAQVCTGRTGHAEVVQITFDPASISFKEILEVFFTFHDPTTPNQQGADVGPQYRSIILYHAEKQKVIAGEVIREIEAAKMWDTPLVTEIVPFQVFNRAEDYHQAYFKNNPGQGYCQVVIAPKVAKFRKAYAAELQSDQDL